MSRSSSIDKTWKLCTALTAKRTDKLGFVVVVIVVTSIFTLTNFNQHPIPISSTVISEHLDCGKICSYEWDAKEAGKFYPLLRKRVNCAAILHRMQHPPNPVVRPPPRQPPAEQVQDYTQNGSCPIRMSRYYDESGISQQWTFDTERFNQLLAREKVENINTYGGSNALNLTLLKYVDHIQDKHVAVIGTQIPWAEAMMINRGARKVTTCEYNKLVIEHPLIDIITPYKLAGRLRNESSPELFDAAFTFSSLEHSGLGRYGDPLTPFGDMEAVAQMWCMMKPGGVLFLGLPVSADRKECWYEWNAHRIYGYERLQHVTANWEILDDVITDTPIWNHAVIVLRKISDSR